MELPSTQVQGRTALLTRFVGDESAQDDSEQRGHSPSPPSWPGTDETPMGSQRDMPIIVIHPPEANDDNVAQDVFDVPEYKKCHSFDPKNSVSGVV
mmetsp:Transcript_63836/g.169000  ORF Transcript_63836/g.169000 Transcript_63836/m.169000 type:complete len:96 (-) Transcript_63836:382-669(-)